MSSLVQRKPPMLARPSFFADMVEPSAFENISRAISRGVLSAKPASRDFDEVGIFSEAAGVDIQRDAILLADLLYFADVGHRHGLAAAGVVGDREHHERDFLGSSRSISSWRRSVSMFPLKGKKWAGSLASGVGRSTAVAPTNPQFARVVSKCVLFGTMSPFLQVTLKRMRSAARPWCVGITWRNSKIACTASRKRAKLGEPA